MSKAEVEGGKEAERADYEQDGTNLPIRDLDAVTTDIWLLMQEAERKGYPHETQERRRRNE